MKVQEIMLKNKYLSSKSVIHDHKKLSDILKENIIIESGSTENGNYEKYANGKMICFQTVQGSVAVTTQWGTLYHNIPVIETPNFPVPFVDVPFIVMTNHGGESSISPVGEATKDKPEDVVLLRGTTSPSTKYKIDIISIGKWKN